MSEPSLMLQEAIQRDMDAREAALDTTRSFIVQAPAGSGKTELLIQRYLSLLSTVTAPEEIIAITFTRKAATEMRVRILQALRAAGEADARSAHARRTQQLARAALRRDAEQRWSLRDQPGRLRILTIDALNGWIVRQMPWLSGLGPVSSVTDDSALFYREAVRTVLLGESGGAPMRMAVRRLLVHLDNRFRSVEDLLVDMLSIRDQWMELITAGIESQAARVMLERSLLRTITAHLEKLRASVKLPVLQESVSLASHAAAVIDADPVRSVDALAGCLGSVEIPGTSEDDLPLWLGLRHLLLTEGDEFRKPRGITIRLGFSTNDPMKDRLIAVLEQVSENEEFRQLLAGLRSLPAARFDDSQWDVVGSMVAILDGCAKELRSLFTRRNATDHIEVAAAARRALGDELEPTDLSLLLEYRIRHLLVDEFQDTSSSQFLLLRQLTAGWSAPDLHTLFLVGDPMQSIYRFREAEVGLFLQVWQQKRLGNVPLTVVRITRNFRSQEGIVSWVNETFAHMMPESSDAAAGAVAYAPSVAVHPAEAEAVVINVEFSGNRADEAREIAAFVRRVLDGEECGEVESVAVLVRARPHLAELIPVLRAAGLRYRSVEIESLARSSAVQDVLSLTRALLFPADRIAWLAVLRAPFCGMTLSDVHALCRNDGTTPMRALLADAERRQRLSADGLARADRTTDALAAASSLRGRLPLRSLVEGCWLSLGAPALLDASELDAALAFLSLLEQHDKGGEIDDVALLEQSVSLLYAPPDPEGDPRLQLMTVHKAKGLQFDVVVLPRLDGVPRQDADRLLLWDRSLGDNGLEFLIAPVRERGGDTEPIYSFIKKTRAMKSSHESVRMLYVAATRAKRMLYLSATMKEGVRKGEVVLNAPRPRSFFASLWPLLQEEIEQRYAKWCAAGNRQSVAEDAAAKPSLTLRRVPPDWRPPSLPAESIRVEARRRDVLDRGAYTVTDLEWRAGHGARAAGVVVHALLQRIAEEGATFWTGEGKEGRTVLLRALFRAEGFANPSSEIIERAVSAVDRILSDEKGRWLLAAHAESECELALTGIEGNAVIAVKIDRTFVDADGVRWIVDYKTATHEGAALEEFLDGQERLYLPQLERYARMMRAWDTRPVRAALYFPLLQRWREVALSEDVT
ncbi:MAG: UvrD-helicase domain-containing protein [Bacteroidetes bacterium]|nr:UvrD-helicase domain-containing protein [Bacteroidota bacterium]